MKESDLFPPVKEWLESHSYTVYSEVVPHYMSTRADVVGVTPLLTTVVELKQSLSLDLIEQAIDWIPHANYVWVAVPKRKGEIKRIVRKLLKDNGIGLIEVDMKPFMTKTPTVKESPTIQARFHRRITDNIKKALTDYHLKHSPDGGHAGGGYVTQYRITMIKVKELLEAVSGDTRRWTSFISRWYTDEKGQHVELKDLTVDGWLDMKTILQYCETHYASPKQSLAAALQNFETNWCEVKKESGKLWYRIKKAE